MVPVVKPLARRHLPIFLTLVLLLPLGLTTTHADHWDAPPGWESATDVGLGAPISFQVTDQGPSPWYRFSPILAHQGAEVRVTWDGSGELRGYIVDDTGRTIDIFYFWSDGAETRTQDWLVHTFGSEGIRTVFVLEDALLSNVTLTVDAIELPDLAITSMEVENVPFTTDQGDLPAGIHRRIHVTITNQGAGTAKYADVGVRIEGRTVGNTVWLDSGTYSSALAPGASESYTLWWDTTGQFGDFRVTADAYGWPYDLDHSNNFQTMDHYVLVGGTGIGVAAGG